MIARSYTVAMKKSLMPLEVAVLGAGPAGVTTACGLHALGHTVALLGQPRGSAVEGLSERTLTQLRAAGLAAAAASARGPALRTSVWGRRQTARGYEHVIERLAFDRALLIDAARLGVQAVPVCVTGVEPRANGWRVKMRDGAIDCRAVVDARGRRSRRASLRGPSLVAVTQAFRTSQLAVARTAVFALDDGWCWLAEDGTGMLWLQVVGVPRASGRHAGLAHRIAAAVDAAPEFAASLATATPTGSAQARAAVARTSTPAAVPGFIRVGDAALAMDPLYGHGVYEALASAHVAVAGIHTFLVRGEWTAVERFVNERTRDVWHRTTMAAAHFYREQCHCGAAPFWTRTAAAYEALAAATGIDDTGAARIELRPVLNGPFIELRRVVVTPQRPRGVWQVDSVELASLVDFLAAESGADLAQAARRLERPPVVVAGALRWLTAQGLIGSSVMRRADAPAVR